MGLFTTAVTALTGPDVDWELDPAITLHPTYEEPAWRQAQRLDPSSTRWLIPQAPLDTMAGMEGSSSWVDLLFCSPWRQINHVIEIGPHDDRTQADAGRDDMLDKALYRVHRHFGHNQADPVSEFNDLLIRLFGRSEKAALNRDATQPPTSAQPQEWPERYTRPGWDIQYTTAGGRFRADDPLRKLEGEAEERVSRLASHAFFATSTGPGTSNTDIKYWATICQKVLQRGDRPPLAPRTECLLSDHLVADDGSVEAVGERLLVPAAVNRFGLAIVSAVLAGHLEPGAAWNIDLEDPTGLVGRAVGGVLDLLAAIDVVWTTRVVPKVVSVNGTVWERTGSRYDSADRVEGGDADLRIVLDPYRPPHAELPTAHLPTVVVRSAFLPVRPNWIAPVSLPPERRNVVPTDSRRDALNVIVEDVFGHESFREGQLGAIFRALAGLDTAVMLPTGTGKSLIFQMAGLLRPGLTISVDPLVSLIDDQTRGLRLQGIDRVAHLTSASIHGDDGEALLKSVGGGDSLFAFLTPERLQSKDFRKRLKKVAKSFLINFGVVDEAHCVSEWGHNFRPAYLRLSQNLRELCADSNGIPPPILALTATASPTVRIEMFRELCLDSDDPEALQTPTNHDRPNLHLRLLPGIARNRRSRLKRVVYSEIPECLGEDPAEALQPRGDETSSIIVFVPHVNGQFGIVGIKSFLEKEAASRDLRPGVGWYGGEPKDWDLSVDGDWDEIRRQQAEAFIDNEIVILVATKGFGMGIDKPNIRATIHYGMPGSVEAFAQEYGRAGRDGADSWCILLATLPDDEQVGIHLDLTADHLTRKKRHDDRQVRFDYKRAEPGERLSWTQSTDLDHQLFFHYQSFPGVDKETDDARRLLAEVWDGSLEAIGGSIEIDRSRWPGERYGSDTTARAREMALCRLYLLDLVDDYTVQYPYREGGADNFEVQLADFDTYAVDEAIRRRGRDLEPGRGEVLNGEVAVAPDDLVERCHHHIGLLLDIHYRTIEPARIRAIDEMRRVATSGLDGEELAARISAYLGDGLLASSLQSTIRALQETVTHSAILTALRTVLLVGQLEREGATARQLELTSNHPLALLAAATTIANSLDGDNGRFVELVGLAYDNLGVYVPDDIEAGLIFRSVRDHVAGDDTGRPDWAADLWNAWPEDRLSAIGELATEIIEDQMWHDDRERQVALLTRLRLDATEALQFATSQTGGTGS